MPIRGLLQILDVAQLNRKEKRLRELLTQKACFSEDIVNFMVWSIDYLWLSQNDRKKAIQHSGLTGEELEERINNAFMLMFQLQDIADLVVGNKRKATELHQQAIAWRFQIQHANTPKP